MPKSAVCNLQRAAADRAAAPGNVHHSILLSASAIDPKGIDGLRDGKPTATALHFDLNHVSLPPQASSASLSNVSVYLVGPAPFCYPLRWTSRIL